jgi:hypothetical protein
MVAKQVKGTRTERANERAAIGRLSANRVSERTRQRYLIAAEQFLAWVRGHGLPHASTWEELEWQLTEYVEYLWETGETKGLANDTLSGVSHFLRTRRRYPGAWQLLTVWSRLEVPNRAPPLSAHMAMALAGWGLQQGRIDFSAAVVTGFHLSLRVAEILSLAQHVITIGPDFRGGVSLPWTKTSQQRGAREVVSIDDPLVGWLITEALAVSPHSKVLQMSGPAFRVMFNTGIAALGLSQIGYRPYSIRRGGATHDFLAHHDLQRSLLRGRWSQLRTAKIYVTDGAALIQELKLTPCMHSSISFYRELVLRKWMEFVNSSCA